MIVYACEITKNVQKSKLFTLVLNRFLRSILSETAFIRLIFSRTTSSYRLDQLETNRLNATTISLVSYISHRYFEIFHLIRFFCWHDILTRDLYLQVELVVFSIEFSASCLIARKHYKRAPITRNKVPSEIYCAPSKKGVFETFRLVLLYYKKKKKVKIHSEKLSRNKAVSFKSKSEKYAHCVVRVDALSRFMSSLSTETPNHSNIYIHRIIRRKT